MNEGQKNKVNSVRLAKPLSNGVKFPAELRSDPLSKDWVIIATGRGKRPESFKKERKKKIIPPKKTCPFCHLKGEKAIFKNWTAVVIPNKYPALIPSLTLKEEKNDFYQKMNGVGYHEVVVFKDHQKSLALFSVKQIKEVISAYQERYLDLMKKPFVKYISIFHNHGQEAGASVFHPHSQILATPVIDPDLNRAVLNSKKSFEATKKCIYCQMNNWEIEKKERIVFENKEFLVICPFVSKAAFEMIITPKKHSAYFERIGEEEKEYLAEAFKEALFRLYKALNDPAYNFYLHTAPIGPENYDSYHWHWTILPKTAIWAGFELCTGIEISTIEPERAAEYLRKQ